MSQRFFSLTAAISRLDALIRRSKSVGVQDLEMPGSWSQILYVLHRNPAGLTFSQLSRQTGMDAGQTSRTLSKMEKSGLICRPETPGYKGLCSLSTDGAKAASLVARRIETAEARVRQGISQEEMDLFYDVSRRLADNLEGLLDEWRK